MKARAFVCIPHVKDKGTAVDVEILPLVVCKECNKRGTSECYVENASGELAFPWIPPDDWFCADGERKGSGE